jgi:hypothetical protein
MTNNVIYPFRYRPSLKSSAASPATSALAPVTALSVEFVAKPEESHRVQAAIPAALAGALKDVDGFAGCLVMISDHEARLVTVVTLWAGNDRAQCCRQNTRWVHALLKPYLDRCLRVQTMIAHLPVLPMFDFLSARQSGINSSEDRSIMQDHISEDETVCIA